MRVLVTGGTGYIGSHTILKLLERGHEVRVVDNFCNSSPVVFDRIALIAGIKLHSPPIDLLDVGKLDEVFLDFKPDAVIHFAGLKSVKESSERPLQYFESNLVSSINLLRAMDKYAGCHLVFSSSATVYGEASYLPYDELHPLNPTNPYGRTKLYVEQLLQDWCAANQRASAVSLRYFNPVGAHSSGLLGENPSGVPNNLFPYVSRVAIGVLPELKIHGNDYKTRDGTGERDYIHVEDLADAHISALNYCVEAAGYDAFNVGTGQGFTVLEVVKAFTVASGQALPYVFGPRRSGDVARSIACVKKTERILNWRASRGLQEMCDSAWNWETNNSYG